MPEKTILVVGTVNVDNTLIVNRVPDAGESVKSRDYKQSMGGKGANSAIAAFRSCHRKISPNDDKGHCNFETTCSHGDHIDVRIIAAIGDDANGTLCVNNLHKNGIHTSAIRTVPGSMTGISFCIVEQDTGQNRVMSYRGANDSHKPEDYKSIDSLLVNGALPDLLISHLAIPLNAVEQLLETAGKAGVEILLNAAPAQPIVRRLYKYITHFIVNETEAGILSGCRPEDVNVHTCSSISKKFLRKGVKNVVITLGEHGAYYATKDETGSFEEGHVPAYPVKVLDSTGAGDMFVGAYASDYVHQKNHSRWEIKAAVEHASGASAFSIGSIGAQSTIPWSEEIDTLQTKYAATSDLPVMNGESIEASAHDTTANASTGSAD